MDHIVQEKFMDKLFETFRQLIDCLEQHHLQWFAAYGTAIGGGTLQYENLNISTNGAFSNNLN